MIEVLSLRFIKKNQWPVTCPTLQDNTSGRLHSLLTSVSCGSCGYSFAFSLPLIHVHCFVPNTDPSKQPSIMQDQLLSGQQIGWCWFHTSPPVPPYTIHQFHPQLYRRTWWSLPFPSDDIPNVSKTFSPQLSFLNSSHIPWEHISWMCQRKRFTKISYQAPHTHHTLLKSREEAENKDHNTNPRETKPDTITQTYNCSKHRYLHTCVRHNQQQTGHFVSIGIQGHNRHRKFKHGGSPRKKTKKDLV